MRTIGGSLLVFLALAVGCAGKQLPPSSPRPLAPERAVQAPPDAPAPVTSGLPELKPRRSKFGKLCEAWALYACEELCKQGQALSCSRLGYILALGGAENPILPVTKFEPDLEGARAAWQKACESGYQPSCVQFARLMDRGVGGERDAVGARRIRVDACSAGYGDACYELAAHEPPDKAIKLYEKGCEGGYANACVEAGAFYEEQDFKRAMSFYSRAFFAPTKAKGTLICPKGTQLFRQVEELEFAYLIREPAIFCGRLEGRRPKKQGPYIRFATLEDEEVHGVVVARGRYENDRKQGLWEGYDAHGKLLSRENFDQGQEHALCERFQADETNYHEKTNYVHGKRHGKYSLRYDDLSETGQYEAGKKQGLWTRIRTVVRYIKTETRYQQGKIVGDEVSYYKDGTVEHSTPHDADGAVHGTVRYFREDGTLRAEMDYLHGTHRATRDYARSGKLAREAVEQPGGAQRVKEYYDTGQLRLEYTYDDGDQYDEREYDRSGKPIRTD
ncbi:MAG: hypothetical protein H6718_06635 [Polyangiaceae bacterium]|nr:hypothetical protein [Polyangiaceae bacterium]